MMELQNTGGCAFPQDLIDMHGIRTSEGGMTLRDYFAAQAMKEMDLGNCMADDIARDAYWIADAMLAERAK